MAKSNPRVRPTNIAPGSAISHVGAVPTEERIPPLTISLKAFVKNGSDSEFRQLIFELLSLSSQMQRHSEHFARYIGTNTAQYRMMTIMAEMPDLTVSQIAELMSVTSQFVTIEIGKLIKNGNVWKRPNNSDRRSSFLNLTSKGKSLVRELAPLQRRANDLHFRSLTEDRARILKEIIHTIVADGRRVIHELEAPDILNEMAPSARSEAGIHSGVASLTRKRTRRRSSLPSTSLKGAQDSEKR